MVSSLARKIKDPEEKRAYNLSHFTRAAANYDSATKFLSLGNDARWKARLLQELPPMSAPKVLDLACGTGDLCFGVIDKYKDAEVCGIDITPEMIRLARERAKKRGIKCTFIEGDISRLDVPENHYDLITAGYAFRNAPELERTIDSVVARLKSGGTLAILDFAKAEKSFSQRAQAMLMKYWGGLWGTLLDKTFSSHSYIGSSLELFPSQKQFLSMLTAAGLELEFRKKCMFGAVEILILKKN